MRPGVVEHTCNPNYVRYRDGKIDPTDKRICPGKKKLAKPYVKSKPGIVAHAWNPSYTSGGGRKIIS
jgi:hypothetical protein